MVRHSEPPLLKRVQAEWSQDDAGFAFRPDRLGRSLPIPSCSDYIETIDGQITIILLHFVT